MFEQYNERVKLLLTCLPSVSRVTDFALKGGTAINMFIREQYPRMSVDIDLTYLPIQGRQESLLAIEKGLQSIAKELQEKFNYKIQHISNTTTGTITKLQVKNNLAEITIEPNLILRGTLYPIEHRDLSQKVQSIYSSTADNIPLLSFEEIYAGKICAALDRQHPRDLFDVKFILEEGISDKTKIAFLIYLISNNRPMFELLSPNRIDQRVAYNNEFLGMTEIRTSYEELEEVREQLISTINNILSIDDKQFLVSVKKGEPNWGYIKIPQAENLPSVKWKLMNIKKMDKQKANDYLKKLESVLYG